jgi:hypothetical protein
MDVWAEQDSYGTPMETASVHREEVNMGITRKRSSSSTDSIIQISTATVELSLHGSCKRFVDIMAHASTTISPIVGPTLATF